VDSRTILESGAAYLLVHNLESSKISTRLYALPIIMNNAVMEMPSEKDGRFVPFMAGGLVYGLILLPLG